MRRPLTLAAFFLAISVIPVCAQHGGGHASGGSHGGFSGGHSSFSGASHVSSAGHAGYVGHTSAYSGARATSSYSRYGSRPTSYGRAPYVRNGRAAYGYRNRYGYPYGYPYYGLYAYGGIDPYWWWDTYSDDPDEAQQRAEAADMNAENLDEQQALREQDQPYYPGPVRRPRPAAPTPVAAQADTTPATVLIFRDQHQREIRNYAIVDEMLWVFTPQRIEKVPLAILDVPATIKANDDRGVDFRLPESSSGQ